ncbi:Uncharacterized protein LACOL_0698 [Paucilactobacillus oligofermentans DSM 15707 = LMG 22743]|nr:teichoic acid D-Ala incorporation-associated protein DltX [Paucilactobacillus oligofermentans]CUS26006.1 Uncharacterized protein LACOL_0698 [Paucilactobacillus oligofermentans DSM 15707 = LMG 22743]
MQILERLKQKPIIWFLLKAGFYFLIIMILIYMYEYSGVNNSGFIYNEF